MRKIKAAVIGSGFMGAAHVEALQRIGGVEIKIIASDDVASARKLAEKFSIEKVVSSWEDVLIDKEIEVVHNCTPNFLHHKINKETILSGKHIISEKPLTTSSIESKELVYLANQKGVVNAINFNYRFYPVILHARSIISNGELGEIYFAHGSYLQDWLLYDTDYNWRLESKISGSSRAVADIGSHWCDMIQFLTGLKITKVFADLFTIHEERVKPAQSVETFVGKELIEKQNGDRIKIDTEDGGVVIFHFENGRRGVFSVSQVSAGRKNYFNLEIDGSKKALSWNQEEPNSLWFGYREKLNESLIKDPSLLDKSARGFAHYPGGHPEGYPDGPKNLFMSVYDLIRSGRDPRREKTLFANFEDGYYENKIIEAILTSSKINKWVEIK
jgi:predicted dehydrogenase